MLFCLLFLVNEQIIRSFSGYKAYVNEDFSYQYHEPGSVTSLVSECFFDDIEERRFTAGSSLYFKQNAIFNLFFCAFINCRVTTLDSVG
jgi:hypothetical protein